MMRPKPVIVGTATVLLLSMLSGSVNAAGNGNANCGIPLTRFAGETDSPAATGICAHLDPQLLAICTQPNGERRATFAWSAVQLQQLGCSQGGCPNSIIQIGRGTCYDIAIPYGCSGTGAKLLTAWGRDPQAAGCAGTSLVIPFPFSHGPAPLDNGYHYYRVSVQGSTWQFDHWPKGKALQVVRWIPASNICWLSREAAMFNETWNVGDALGGSVANHYQFMHGTVMDSVGAPWIPISIEQPCDDWPTGIFHCEVTGIQQLETWTDR